VPGNAEAVAGDGAIDVSWNASNAADLAGYSIYTSTSSATGPWTLLPGGLVADTSRHVTGLSNGTQIWITVTATDTSGNESARSTAAAATQRGDPPAVINECGTLDANETWTADSVHSLTCVVVVPDGVTLTVTAGAVIKGDGGSNCSYNVGCAIAVRGSGTLNAAGTAANPITLTSINDNSIGGTTGTGTPAAGDWDGIWTNAGHVILDQVKLDYAATALRVDGSEVAIRGKVLNSIVGVQTCNWQSGADCAVDATNVDWGSAAGPFADPAPPRVCGAVTVDPWVGEDPSAQAYMFGSENCDGSKTPDQQAQDASTTYYQAIAGEEIDCGNGFQDACAAIRPLRTVSAQPNNSRPTTSQSLSMCRPQRPTSEANLLTRVVSSCAARPAIDETHENCPRNALRASRRNARETVSVVVHEEWVVDDVSCRGHHQVRQGVCEGLEEGQGPDPGPDSRGDGLVA
jgi:hypothetical protein